MKKSQCVLALAVFFIALFSGLAPVCLAEKITFYSNRADLVEKGHFARWQKEFKKIKPRIDVEVRVLERYNQEMLARISRGDYGDVLLLPAELPRFAWPNYFLALDDLQAEKQLYFNDKWQYQGRSYALALGATVDGLIYNKPLFEKHQLAPPTTRSELLRLAKTLKSQGVTPFALNVAAAWPLQQWEHAALVIAQEGDYFSRFSNTGTQATPFDNQSAYAQALTLARNLFDEGLSEASITRDYWQQSKAEFAQGNIAMLYMGSWVLPQLLEQGISLEQVGFVPMPLMENQGSPVLLSANWGVAINKNTPNPLSSKAWLRFLLFESDYPEVSGLLPVDKKRESALAPLQAMFAHKVSLLLKEDYSPEFLRMANKVGLDVQAGNSIRNILINPDFYFSLEVWKARWQHAQNGSEG